MDDRRDDDETQLATSLLTEEHGLAKETAFADSVNGTAAPPTDAEEYRLRPGVIGR